MTRAGSEDRVFKAGTRELLGTRIVDTGGGYCSQNAMPVHFGLGAYEGRVDVELTTFRAGKRVVTAKESVDPALASNRPVLAVRAPR